MNRYLTDKRIEVLNAIKPICEVFGIKDFDYIIDTEKGIERLKLNDTLIGCGCNSILAVVDEAIEKQIPAKPLPYKGFDGQCPDCKVIFLDRATNYCGNCGKKIDWEEE